MQVLQANRANDAYTNPVPVIDKRAGVIHLLANRYLHRDPRTEFEDGQNWAAAGFKMQGWAGGFRSSCGKWSAGSDSQFRWPARIGPTPRRLTAFFRTGELARRRPSQGISGPPATVWPRPMARSRSCTTQRSSPVTASRLNCWASCIWASRVGTGTIRRTRDPDAIEPRSDYRVSRLADIELEFVFGNRPVGN